MRRGGPQHPKVVLLAAALNIPRAYAVGLLECLWHFTAQYAPHGDVGRHDDRSIAAGAGWEGEAEPFIATLCGCRFLDVHPTHRLVIHNWNTHADQTTQRTVSRSGRAFIGGRKLTRKRTSSKLAKNWQKIASGYKAKALAEHCVKTSDQEQEEALLPTTLRQTAASERSKSEAEVLIAEINQIGGKRFREAGVNLDFAKARLADYPLTTLRAMVRWRWRTWEPPMRAEYFRPQTLLNATKCESYVGSMPASELTAFIPAAVVAPTPLALKFAERDRLAREKILA